MDYIDTVWRHRKGGHYTIIGERGDDFIYAAHKGGRLFVRNKEEFLDGRFTRHEPSGHPFTDPLTLDHLGIIRG